MLKVIDVWAPWCGPCKAMMPTIEALMAEYNKPESKVQVLKVNADEDSDFVKLHKISSIPTLLFEKDGEVVDRVSGNKSKTAIIEIINKHLG